MRRPGASHGAHVAAVAVVAGIAGLVVLLPSDQRVEEPAVHSAMTAPESASTLLDESIGECCMTEDGQGYYSTACLA